MKLTKLQRYTVYCIMLEEIENPTYEYFRGYGISSALLGGFCWLFRSIFSSRELYKRSKSILPELYKKYKYKNRYYAFDTWEERKEALKQCIIETHP